VLAAAHLFPGSPRGAGRRISSDHYPAHNFFDFVEPICGLGLPVPSGASPIGSPTCRRGSRRWWHLVQFQPLLVHPDLCGPTPTVTKRPGVSSLPADRVGEEAFARRWPISSGARSRDSPFAVPSLGEDEGWAVADWSGSEATAVRSGRAQKRRRECRTPRSGSGDAGQDLPTSRMKLP
jgi:hypothetical protein